MPFYKVEQRGVPGLRLVEADTPAQARNHVVNGAFTTTKVEGRDLIDAAKEHTIEIAGEKPKDEPATDYADETVEPETDEQAVQA